MSKLRYCPKCGADRPSFGVIYRSHRLFTRYYIKCWNCKYTGRSKISLNRAAKAWNKLPRLPREVLCFYGEPKLPNLPGEGSI